MNLFILDYSRNKTMEKKIVHKFFKVNFKVKCSSLKVLNYSVAVLLLLLTIFRVHGEELSVTNFCFDGTKKGEFCCLASLTSVPNHLTRDFPLPSIGECFRGKLLFSAFVLAQLVSHSFRAELRPTKKRKIEFVRKFRCWKTRWIYCIASAGRLINSFDSSY